MRTLQAIILAAGEGTRMKSERPKVLHPICGRPMIAYALDLAASVGAKRPVVILGFGAEQVRPALPTEAKVVLQSKQLGTGDAVIAAKKAFGKDGSLIILYADTPLLRRTTVQKLVEAHFKTSATATLLTAHLADPSGYGRIHRNEQGQIDGIIEEAEANAAQRAIREINVGPIVFQIQPLLEALAALTPSTTKKELYVTGVISHLARQEGAKIHATRVEEVAEALGINSRAELARATGVIRQRIVDSHLANGVTIEDPHATFIDQGVSIGADTVLHPYTVIETGVSIGKRCSIGPFARIRRGVSLADDVRVGNFAELVRTKLGARVRMNHMSYLGDATVEEDVNIGAGTITANYDGQAKYPTHIGKGAFIGSDTVLIAPVKVGAGAVTGAGSVVPKAHDVPAKGVVVGVPARLVGERSDETNGKAPSKSERPAVSLKSGRRPKLTRVRKAHVTKPARRIKPARRKPARRAKTARRPKRVVRPAKRPARKIAARRRPQRAVPAPRRGRQARRKR